MAQNRMMNLSSSQELPHLKPKAFRPSWLLPVKSIQFDLPGGEGLEYAIPDETTQRRN